MIVRTLVALLLALAPLSLAWAQSPSADDQALAEAKRHFEAGKNAYTSGDYQTAIREFKAAEALRPSALLAYNIGLANEKLGKRRVAVKYYRRYLEGAPGAPNRAEVEGRIASLERDIAANPGGAQGGQPQTERPSDMPPEMPPPPPPVAGQPPQQPGYDPYAPQQPGQPQPVTAAKKRNLWWVWMIVGIGSAVLLGAIIGVTVWVIRNNNAYYATGLNQSLTTPPPSSPSSSHRAPDTANLTIRF